MIRALDRLRNRRGQSLVEFAVVTPLLLLLIVGLMEFGRAWNISQVVTNAAREGARKAAVLDSRGVELTPAEATDSVNSIVARVLLDGSRIVCNTCVKLPISGIMDGPNTPVAVEVTVLHQFTLLGPVMALANQSFTNDPIPLRSVAVMRNE
jgi:TadE-like protein